ncbi:MAG: polysaccharide biosynthesis tyrosine autokinase [Clostridia bacterium]|nr:polysaccharide biosynthesis tyrosine autokinase [Clostridia bacterium]
MNENINKKNEVVDIDLKRLLKAVWRKVWLICIVSILGAAAALAWTIYMVTPLYKSSAMFYVNNSSISMGDASLSISSADISASKNLVKTYAVILQSRSCLNDVIDYANLDYSYGQLRGMISASSVNETEVFQVVVTSPDPTEAERIANAIAYILPNQITDIVEGTSAKIVDYAVAASAPSSPDYSKNTFLGFLVGLGLSVCVIVLRALYDVTIRNEEDIEQCTSHPILAAVPDMNAHSKGGYYYYGYGRRRKKYYNYAYSDAAKKSKKKKDASAPAAEEKPNIGKDISFAASEAYKLLRTKLQFSFVDDIECPVIGVSSALAGEGKSLSSINLAYSLAQLDKKVLLIDCDMRRPSLCTKLPVQKTPGLSDYLTGQTSMDDALQACRVDEEGGFAVIASGRNPPNPIELLSSAKMGKAIAKLREYFDYIILDLPPVGEVSDAMVAAKLVDGILLVVRQDYCNTTALNSAISQFEFIDSRILGIVMNCVGEHGVGYRYYGYGKRYYKKYSKYHRYYGYGYGYQPQDTEKKD